MSSSSIVSSSSSLKHDSQLGDVIDGTAIPYDYYPLFGYKFVATSSINFENMVSASSGYYVTNNANLAAGASVNGNLWCSGNLVLNSNAYVKAVVLGGSLNTQAGAHYGSLVRRSVSVPSVPKKSFSANGSAVNVWAGQSRTLSPGTYGDVNVYSNANLTLEPGAYYFKSLYVSPDATVKSNSNNRFIQLWVQNNVSIGDRASVMKNYGAGHMFVYANGSTDLYIGTQANVSASIVYPNGKVNLAPHSTFTGRVWAKSVTSGANSAVR